MHAISFFAIYCKLNSHSPFVEWNYFVYVNGSWFSLFLQSFYSVRQLYADAVYSPCRPHKETTDTTSTPYKTCNDATTNSQPTTSTKRILIHINMFYIL